MSLSTSMSLSTLHVFSIRGKKDSKDKKRRRKKKEAEGGEEGEEAMEEGEEENDGVDEDMEKLKVGCVYVKVSISDSLSR